MNQRQRRPKKQAAHSRWVGGRCNKQGNLHASGETAEHPCPPEAWSLWGGLCPVGSTIRTVSPHIAVWRLCPNTAAAMEGGAEGTFQGQDGGEEPPVAQVRLSGQPVVTSSGPLPPTTGGSWEPPHHVHPRAHPSGKKDRERGYSHTDSRELRTPGQEGGVNLTQAKLPGGLRAPKSRALREKKESRC